MRDLNEINVFIGMLKGETWSETGSASLRLNGKSSASPTEGFSSGRPLISHPHQADLVSKMWFHIGKLFYIVNYWIYI